MNSEINLPEMAELFELLAKDGVIKDRDISISSDTKVTLDKDLVLYNCNIKFHRGSVIYVNLDESQHVHVLVRGGKVTRYLNVPCLNKANNLESL